MPTTISIDAKVKAAPAAELYALAADPRRHHELDGSGTVGEPADRDDSERDDGVDVVIERAVRDDLFVAVHGHGDTEGESHDQCAEGLEVVERFCHKRFPGFPDSGFPD